MKIQSLLAAVALLALPIAANAADLPVKSHGVVVAPAAASWSGLYFGGVAGIGNHTTELGDPDENWAYGSPTTKGTAVNLGGTVGYNWQYRSFVYGLEGDLSWTNYKKDTFGYDSTSVIHSQWDWFSTARARAGIVFDNTLFYLTGGAAFVKTNHTAQYNYSPYMCGESGGYWSCSSSTRTGLAVGGGVEAMLWSHWSAKAEYLYISLPSVTTNDMDYIANWNDSAHIVRFGLNYHY